MHRRERLTEKTSYEGYQSQKSTNPKEVVIELGPAFGRQITKTANEDYLDEVLRNVKAGIEEGDDLKL